MFYCCLAFVVRPPVKYVFWRPTKFNQYPGHAQMVFKILASLIRKKINEKFLLASLKTLANSKNCTSHQISVSIRLSFALVGRFFPVYIHGHFSEQVSESHAAFRTTFSDTGGCQKSGTSPVKRFTGRIFTISKCFKKQKLYFFLSFTKRQLKLWKP